MSPPPHPLRSSGLVRGQQAIGFQHLLGHEAEHTTDECWNSHTPLSSGEKMFGQKQYHGVPVFKTHESLLVCWPNELAYGSVRITPCSLGFLPCPDGHPMF